MTDAVATTPEPNSVPAEALDHEPLSPAYRRYALGVLLAIYTLNFLDRQVINILAEPIKQDLQLADWQLGMMTGLAFALFYTVLMLPIARLAERGHRPWIIASATAIWSLFTILCGMSQTFLQLFLARIGVGIGEAGCSPPAHSLISDYVPKSMRSSALAFYSIGTPLGSLLGMVMGGLAADAFGWRTAFLIAGAPGLIMACVAAITLVEPRVKKPTVGESPSVGAALREIAGKKTFWLIAFGAGFMAFQGYGHQAFAASFFLRNHAEELAQLSAQFGLKPIGLIGIGMGLITGIGGIVGTVLGGQLADRLGAKDLRHQMAIPAIGALIGFPVYILAMLQNSAASALIMMLLPTLLSTLWYGPAYASSQSLVSPRTRATAAAITLFVANLVGLGCGPLFVGILSDTLSGPMGMGSALGVKWALILGSLGLLVAAALFWIARNHIREDTVS
jgi:MFS family permease